MINFFLFHCKTSLLLISCRIVYTSEFDFKVIRTGSNHGSGIKTSRISHIRLPLPTLLEAWLWLGSFSSSHWTLNNVVDDILKYIFVNDTHYISIENIWACSFYVISALIINYSGYCGLSTGCVRQIYRNGLHSSVTSIPRGNDQVSKMIMRCF